MHHKTQRHISWTTSEGKQYILSRTEREDHARTTAAGTRLDPCTTRVQTRVPAVFTTRSSGINAEAAAMTEGAVPQLAELKKKAKTPSQPEELPRKASSQRNSGSEEAIHARLRPGGHTDRIQDTDESHWSQ